MITVDQLITILELVRQQQPGRAVDAHAWVNTGILILGIAFGWIKLNATLNSTTEQNIRSQSHELKMNVQRRISDLGEVLIEDMQTLVDQYGEWIISYEENLSQPGHSEAITESLKRKEADLWKLADRVRCQARKMSFYEWDEEATRTLIAVQSWAMKFPLNQRGETLGVQRRLVAENLITIYSALEDLVPRACRISELFFEDPDDLKHEQKSIQKDIVRVETWNMHLGELLEQVDKGHVPEIRPLGAVVANKV